MASITMYTWVAWLLWSSTFVAATAQHTDETSTQTASAVKKHQNAIVGCIKYDSAGKCTDCTALRYQLTAEGACECSPGFERSSVNSTCKRGGACLNNCGKAYLDDGSGGICSCDYWCDNHGDCCGGSASKNALCRTMTPTLNKARTGSCSLPTSQSEASISQSYRPLTCWCDAFCTANNDCCPLCSQPMCNKQNENLNHHSTIDNTATIASFEVRRDSSSSSTSDVSRLQAIVAAEAAALIELNGHLGDCPVHHRVQEAKAAIAASVGAAGVGYEIASERIMQQCQAQDVGAPESPYIITVHWTAAQVCDESSCIGGDYTTADVKEQIVYINNLFARVGIQFTWDEIIHLVNATSLSQINSDNWICKLPRYGDKPYKDQPTVHVVTGPEHLGGALGYTWYANMFGYGGYPECLNWVHIYEKTLPGLGGRSVVDGGLSDSGAVLAHEIGHQLMLHHTWYEAGQPAIKQQCIGSASQRPEDIAAGKSDGVRDTPAQSLNGTANGVTNILRFVNCDPVTGAYTNKTAFAQQSCTSAVGFPEGDGYFNNFNNLMSYGDKTCLRTLTPGQGARARCAYKCMMRMAC